MSFSAAWRMRSRIWSLESAGAALLAIEVPFGEGGLFCPRESAGAQPIRRATRIRWLRIETLQHAGIRQVLRRSTFLPVPGSRRGMNGRPADEAFWPSAA